MNITDEGLTATDVEVLKANVSARYKMLALRLLSEAQPEHGLTDRVVHFAISAQINGLYQARSIVQNTAMQSVGLSSADSQLSKILVEIEKMLISLDSVLPKRALTSQELSAFADRGILFR
jgi:hypothetical protein